MNRQGHESKKFFLGREIEHTPARGLKTLFVVGYQDPADIQAVLDDPYVSIGGDVEHIYFGANHSFDIDPGQAWKAWERMIVTFLDLGFWCSLDLPSKHAEPLLETSLIESNNFIPIISIRLPYIRQFNYNTVIKIDDHDFAATNPGVWCHRLHDLQQTQCFTNWNEYQKDEVLR